MSVGTVSSLNYSAYGDEIFTSPRPRIRGVLGCKTVVAVVYNEHVSRAAKTVFPIALTRKNPPKMREHAKVTITSAISGEYLNSRAFYH